MPKIEVYRKTLYSYLGFELSIEELEELLTVAKAEIDEIDEADGILKIELNDTNRPDLWSTAGLARQLRSFRTGGGAEKYDFFSSGDETKSSGDRAVVVDENIRPYRPYVAAFAVTGKAIDEPSLKDLIQTQEKLCGNFGQKRKSIAMGVYRNDLIQYPVRYRGADPATTRFVPLQMDREMSLTEILSEHPKGRDFASIIETFPLYPYIEDSRGEVLSMPPIINSAHLGAVEVGDDNLFIEMTGTNLSSLQLAISIVACDLADSGYTILPVETKYPYDTEFGRSVVSPYYFQDSIEAGYESIEKMLGLNFGSNDIAEALSRMGLAAEDDGKRVAVRVPPFRNDFLHPVDLIEDIMIGHGMDSFEPIMPSDYTAGRLTPEEHFGRSVKNIMIGMQFQEMIYGYLGSGKDFVERMRISEKELVRIANPMTENYEYVRNSILPSLLGTEAVSGHAAFPHAVFEIGKIARVDPDDNQGSVTRNYLGFLVSDRAIGFNEASAHVRVLFYYLNFEYELAESDDPRYIPGRCATIESGGESVGVLGEIHPEVLERWGVTMPCAACEVDLDHLTTIRSSAT